MCGKKCGYESPSSQIGKNNTEKNNKKMQYKIKLRKLQT